MANQERIQLRRFQSDKNESVSVCVCVCACACARVCVRARVRVYASASCKSVLPCDPETLISVKPKRNPQSQ